ncbi:MAG: arginine--tRNA ligase [Dehalococcoidia bacterium]|jgi:arginyl-tRNA synthetase|nr:MAG: arginine--tRNA ligase [Dehalococcoidia bacterium]
MIRQELARCLQQAVLEAQQKGDLASATLPEVLIEHPQNPEHGDFASGLPLKLARTMKMSPMAIAEKVSEHIVPPPQIDRIWVAEPGFINFILRDDWLSTEVESVLAAGESYGDIEMGKGNRVQVEFVSVNPTGPLHVGHGRGAVLGSTLANVLTVSGYAVEKEFYINDMGNQIDNFGRSLYARYRQCLDQEAAMPPDGYYGNYIIDLAKEIIQEQGDRFLSLPESEAASQLAEVGTAKMLQGIKQDLELLSVVFDTWFSEKSLYQGGQYSKVMELLQSGGYMAKKENATWFESSALGEDKDNVLVRSDGSPTYFASDIAYHYNKFLERKFDRVIDIWGADHQGHVPRMKAMLKALNCDPEQLKVIICQLVTLRRGQEIVKVSKRGGDIITLKEVVDEVGSDACRFIFLSRSADSQMDFDIKLAKRQSADNPVYYVQYAHARIASILQLAKQREIDCSQGDVSLLTTEPELTLIRRLILLPEVVEQVAVTLEPHHLPYYAQDLATVFHSFYKQCRVVSEDEALTKARLKLVKATQIALAKVLHLMGMSVPEKM